MEAETVGYKPWLPHQYEDSVNKVPEFDPYLGQDPNSLFKYQR